MFRRVVAGVNRAFGLQRPGRNLIVFPDDVFIVSYPKSGNTWTRFLIANLMYPEERADFANINRLIPDPEALSKRTLGKMPRPRYIKSHQYFDPRYNKVIYVVRDPRDVAVSQYHFHRKRKLLPDGSPIEEFVSRFVAGKTSIYASWGENVASWLATRYGSDAFLLLRYEDLLAQATKELARVAVFAGIDPEPQRIENAVTRSSATEMREMERTQARMWSSTKDTRQDVPFVRDARSGGWKENLPQSCVAEIEYAWGHLMKFLRYEVSTAQESLAQATGVESILTRSSA
ncbi:MAG TPA: sulfotransferase domain-containing protein [Dongiaceae bacterium]|nr:sulfotransferase domain-containing protein [Dongiaceae bacterium]